MTPDDASRPERRRQRTGEAVSSLPPTREMTVVAQDPSIKGRNGRILMATIDVPAEDLMAGPAGYRVQIVDYDATTGAFHGTHDLPSRRDEPKAWRDGDSSIVDDPRFRAQNVYALVMKTLARFEFALGRRLNWGFKVHQLKVAPTGMIDANAFYSREVEGLVFGYFPGRGGKKVYTCLSQDIVVHETAHALLDAIRERYLEASGPDQAAFHEGFADVIALLSVYAQVELVTELLRRDARNGVSLSDAQVEADALRKTALFGLAEQMGAEMEAVRGDALRRSAEMLPDKGWLTDPEFLEPHRRGEVLVAAVMNAFLEIWTARLRDSKAPGQRGHTVRRVAEEGRDIAAALITMWIRAIDYMPPVNMEFGDALSAALTADSEVRPDDDDYQLRTHVRKSFAAYGIEPSSTRADVAGALPLEPARLHYERVRFEALRTNCDEVFHFLWENRRELGLREGAYTKVLTVDPCLRIGPDGFVLHETVAQYYQVARLTPSELRSRGIKLPPDCLAELKRMSEDASARAAAEFDDGSDSEPTTDELDSEAVIPVYGGGALVFDEFGKLKYHVANDVFGQEQSDRLRHLWQAGQLRLGRDGATLSAARLSDLHRQRATGTRRMAAEGW